MIKGAFKHNLKWNTKAGDVARLIATKTGLFMLRKGRKMLKWSAGRCSWCGANCGMASTISSKGLRCSNLDRNCTNMPDI